jgi:hypothetical protein
MSAGFTCSCCSTWHDHLPMSYGADAPVYWYALPESDPAQRAELSSDQCIIDGQYFFVRCRIEIPVLDSSDPFSWGVWISVSSDNFRRISALWNVSGREQESPFFGWLSTTLPVYPETLNLKTMLRLQPLGERPLVELEPSDHPLSIEQRTGITLHRVQQIAETLLHSIN